jgi:uncharacterized protein YbbC (DUF1343 family)
MFYKKICIALLLCSTLVLAKVKLGVDVLLTDSIELIKGKRVGLITNPTGMTSSGKTTVDALFGYKGCTLAALFGPEHGVRGDIEGGKSVTGSTDAKTGVPVYSLYGKTYKPTAEMLANVDVLVYDIQDIGSRAYTYIYTMALAMEAAKEKNIPFIVLDRPNPLGGERIEGPVLDPKFKSFIGLYPIPYIYGLTVGELAEFFNKEFNIHCRLHVVLMQGWKRHMNFSETGVMWIPTSPHIPHATSPFYCAAVGCIGELHTINEGVGWPTPFEAIGAPWINAEVLAAELNSRNLKGVFFRPLHYRPFYFAFKDQALQGVQIHILDFAVFQPMAVQIHILEAVHKLYPQQDIFATERVASFDKAMGTDAVRKQLMAGQSAEAIMAGWSKELGQFMAQRAKYLRY